MFLIPYNQLSNEQKNVVRRVSREDGNLFVDGPPGSGKTLISLYTLRDIVSNTTVKPLLLMYNHSLYGYLSAAMRELEIFDNITIATKDKFFWDLAASYGIRPNYEDQYAEKYSYILRNLLNQKLEKRYDITVVDEVQDLHSEEWTLIKRLSKRTTSLGDFNQKIYQTNFSEFTLTQGGLKETLSKIFRFHKYIAKLARPFSRTNNDLEGRVTKTSRKIPEKINVKSALANAKVAEILNGLSSNQEARVGVICPDREMLAELSTSLTKARIDHRYYPVNKDLKDFDFTSSIPLLITSSSSKGLEFENVILYGFSKHSRTVNSLRREGRLKDVIYVSITRTNSGLYILVSDDTIDELKNLVIDDQEARSGSGAISIDDIF